MAARALFGCWQLEWRGNLIMPGRDGVGAVVGRDTSRLSLLVQDGRHQVFSGPEALELQLEDPSDLDETQ